MSLGVWYYIEFTPTPQARPRVTRRGTYDPSKKKRDGLRFLLKNVWKQNPIEGPVKLRLNLGMPIPKSFSKKKRGALVGTPHFRRPDLDNMLKFFNDSADGVLWNDDSQVSEIEVSKFYSDMPHFEFQIESYIY